MNVNKVILACSLAIAGLFSVIPSYSYAGEGRVDVWNSPLNIRACGSISCGRVGRVLRDEIVNFEGAHSSQAWLNTRPRSSIDYDMDNAFVYGKYIRNGSASLGFTYSYSYFTKTKSDASLRYGPMVHYDRNTVIPKDGYVEVLGRNGHYSYVRWYPEGGYGVRDGYVHTSLLR